jgi:hypothetical protein
VARIEPTDARDAGTLRDALAAWVGTSDPAFADDLRRINAADRPAANPWES